MFGIGTSHARGKTGGPIKIGGRDVVQLENVVGSRGRRSRKPRANNPKGGETTALRELIGERDVAWILTFKAEKKTLLGNAREG